MSRPTIVKWCQTFEDGRTDLIDPEKEERRATVSTPDMVQRVEDIISCSYKGREAHIVCSEHF